MATRKGRRRSTSGKSNKAYFFLGLLIALCAMGYAYFHHNTSADADLSSLSEVTDDGKNLDCTQAATKLQDGIIKWVKDEGCSVEIVSTDKREERREKTGGVIKWTVQTAVVDGLIDKEKLTKELEKSDGKAVLYRTEDVKKNGDTVTEYDIALCESVDGDTVSMVALKLYVPPKGKAAALAKELKVDKNSSSDGESGEDGRIRHPSQIKARLAVVIDDCGSNMEVLEGYNALPIHLTYAVMPFKSHTIDSAESGHNAGNKIIVHLPMEPLNTVSSEEIFISSDMGDKKVIATTNELIDQVPYAVGINNHQGSKSTADTRLMKDVMSVLKSRGLVFLDSRTTAASVAEQTAASMGVGTTRNNLFIDNDPSVSAIKERIRQAGRLALKNGTAVTIGHCRPATLQALKETYKELLDEGIDFVFVTQFM